MRLPTHAILAIFAVSFAFSATSAAAQWLHYPTPGLPRTSDGRPNLSAPSPRALDGKPDLSGSWLGPAAIRGETLHVDAADIQPWAMDLQRQRAAEFFKSSPQYQCRPSGPQAFEGEMRIVQTSALVAVLYPDLTYRLIFLDGRNLEADPFRTWMGYSVGRWEGDTLVVESFGFNDRTWLNHFGFPHTEQLRMKERYHRDDLGHLTIDVTFTDPGAYNRPLNVTVNNQLITDTELMETVCEDNSDHWAGSVAEIQKSAVVVPQDVLRSYVGVYSGRSEFSDRNRTVTVTLDRGELHVTGVAFVSSDPPSLIPLSDSLFTSTEGMSYKFFRDGTGAVTHLEEWHVSSTYVLRRQ